MKQHIITIILLVTLPVWGSFALLSGLYKAIYGIVEESLTADK